MKNLGLKIVAAIKIETKNKGVTSFMVFFSSSLPKKLFDKYVFTKNNVC
jgi:hypothetical protein